MARRARGDVKLSFDTFYFLPFYIILKYYYLLYFTT